MAYKDITPPAGGKISIANGVLTVPDNPVIPFIRGDGTGRDIWTASEKVFDAAVKKAYGGKKKIAWFEVFAGEASKTKFDNWLPDDTVEAFREFLVGIKGPLTTPVGGGIRSLNVALRQMLDLYVCLRPVQYFAGVPSPVKHPEKVDVVIFRENTEDIYAGIDFEAGSEPALKVLEFLKQSYPKDFKKIRFGGELPGEDAIADITLQQVLTRPEDFDVIATLNLNGDYLSDALAAQVGGIGIAPGGNINYITGHAVFEATHGTAPKYANQDKVNPGSLVLSGEMMFRYMGWTEAADLIIKGLNGAIASKRVTYDFARQMDGATEIKCSEFGQNIIDHM